MTRKDLLALGGMTAAAIFFPARLLGAKSPEPEAKTGMPADFFCSPEAASNRIREEKMRLLRDRVLEKIKNLPAPEVVAIPHFCVGDVVYLKSTNYDDPPGTPMTVEEDMGDSVRCVWFEEDVLYRQEINTEHLALAVRCAPCSFVPFSPRSDLGGSYRITWSKDGGEIESARNDWAYYSQDFAEAEAEECRRLFPNLKISVEGRARRDA
jgi:uncharacterized protein YodC (DUF2158 family)